MKGETSKKVIIPKAIGKLRVRANTVDGYLDCDCYYSPDFTTTLLSEVDIRKATRFPKQYGSQVLAKSFAIDDETLIKDLTTGKDVNLENASEYQMDFGNCKLIFSTRRPNPEMLKCQVSSDLDCAILYLFWFLIYLLMIQKQPFSIHLKNV